MTSKLLRKAACAYNTLKSTYTKKQSGKCNLGKPTSKVKKIHQFLTYFWILPLTVSCTSVVHQFILNMLKVWNINCVCLLLPCYYHYTYMQQFIYIIIQALIVGCILYDKYLRKLKVCNQRQMYVTKQCIHSSSTSPKFSIRLQQT